MTDILLDENDDLLLINGQMVRGESSRQHADLLVRLEKGELRQTPNVGFGIERRLRSVANPRRFLRELKVELENDGFVQPEISANNDLSNFKITVG